ncbi:3-hydroxyacyl-CoA dehydrogenase NAD-binding domain-containing protein [Zavarzinia compransoris]|uniref:3-hydroxyacyl-CoA dehydrogenase n=1 Tax=Zavarzinia compransoris TaxID=1264899 RepID=A0A317E4M3_9PROT|nr:3-hydroxyacyl-CoA dehydrogenase NAD-binding domain-containing protein [Zavarzinia compransoris]PWR22007.1 3-hydroxyacyl-CoA dehydrogenase [Zavarzinia compransoris]TDP47254.1 short chain enoyl-CoA hydratase /3-hydroxyacyl-CoA dehydrogenase [Zavarzinia compransoris]
MRDATYDLGTDGIATVSFDMAGRPVNVMNDDFSAALDEILARLEADRAALKGVIVTSAKATFVAGGDIEKLLALRHQGYHAARQFFDGLKARLRRLETLGVPVVAALNGSALGGGLELALACHRRIAVDDRKIQFAFPEVTLGILPGAGGVVRSVRMLGLLKALPLLTEGRRLDPREALAQGLVDELAADPADLLARARAWLATGPEAAQPWERKGYAIPGGSMFSGENAPMLSVFPAMIFKKTRGLLPAAERILAVAAESTQIGFDAAMAVETRGFLDLLLNPVTENLITSMFFQMNEINGGASRPKGPGKAKVARIGVLGAGMMGRGIAFAAATAGIEVVLRDVTEAAAEAGKAYSADILARRVAKGSLTGAARDETLARIRPTAAIADMAGCDLVIEAVFEDVALKQSVLREAEAVLGPEAVVATNTSTLPITLLAAGVARPANFIGLHFFSPVDKMNIVEIICGTATGDECLARAFDFVQQIRKTPIVVRDSRGFYTSRVFSVFADEGDILLKEGVAPILIENLAKQAGMPVGPLSVQDEVMMSMLLRAQRTNQDLDAQLGDDYAKSFGVCGELCALMCDQGRPGRLEGAGFYDYFPDGSKRIWPGLRELFGGDNPMPHRDVQDRLMFRMVIEALKCLDEGVVTSLRDGNIGSILAFGFPVHTGGVFQYAISRGIGAFLERARELAALYGERFLPPAGIEARLQPDDASRRVA